MAVLSVSVILFEEPLEINSTILPEISYSEATVMMAVWLLGKIMKLDSKQMGALMNAYSNLIPKINPSWVEIELRKEVED